MSPRNAWLGKPTGLGPPGEKGCRERAPALKGPGAEEPPGRPAAFPSGIRWLIMQHGPGEVLSRDAGAGGAVCSPSLYLAQVAGPFRLSSEPAVFAPSWREPRPGSPSPAPAAPLSPRGQLLHESGAPRVSQLPPRAHPLTTQLWRPGHSRSRVPRECNRETVLAGCPSQGTAYPAG